MQFTSRKPSLKKERRPFSINKNPLGTALTKINAVSSSRALDVKRRAT
jgi:hypothetical protein